jgi:hypothetical protein
MSHAFRAVSLIAIIALTQACSLWPDLPPRPPNVPQDAIRLGGPKAQWWVKCTYTSAIDRCTVYNSSGKVLDDNAEYRPYDGGDAVAERDLLIDAKRSTTQVLYLENGRIIILARAFDSHKRDIDVTRGEHR